MNGQPALVFVQIDGRDLLAGRLWSRGQGQRESTTFAYDESYLASPGAYELDPMLPLTGGTHHTAVGRKLFGAFTDCAPDGWGRRLIVRASKAGVGRQPSSYREIDFLLGTRDDMRQGALRFKHDLDADFLASAQTQIPPLVSLGRLLSATESLERQDPAAEDLRILLRAGSSLGGARPKAQVVDTGGRLLIAKFPRVASDDWPVVPWEAATHQLARAAGLSVPPARLEQVDGKPIFLTQRFDRSRERRVGYMSAMAALELTDGQPGDYLDLAQVIERGEDLRQMWRRIAFSMLVSNTDDHLRNHGLLRVATDGWYLSPAFDINPTPHARSFATTLAGDDSGNIDVLMECRQEFRLSEKQAVQILGEVSAAVSSWRGVARKHGLTGQDIKFMADAFEHQAMSAAKGRA